MSNKGAEIKKNPPEGANDHNGEGRNQPGGASYKNLPTWEEIPSENKNVSTKKVS